LKLWPTWTSPEFQPALWFEDILLDL
jgi:hypothetical protein